MNEEVMDLVAKIQHLIDNFVDCPEGHFTFPDGDTWEKTDEVDAEDYDE